MISIGEVARQTGVRASALRYYEEVGLITPVARAGGRRQYDDSVLGRLRVIACAQSVGFTIAEIAELMDDGDTPPERWRPLAERKLREVDAVIEKAQAMRRVLAESLRCDCRSLEECAMVAQPR